ncbi:MAG: endopeptidase La [Salibacteraceae bacterium]
MSFDLEFFDLSNLVSEGGEFIPLLSADDEEQMNAEELPEELPILPLRNTVLFPGVVIPITVGRDKSIRLVQEAYAADKTIGVVSQQDQEVEDPGFDQLNKIGTVAHILKLLRMPDGSTTIIIQGKKRFVLENLVTTEPFLRARVSQLAETKPAGKDKRFNALISSIKDMSLNIIQQSPNIPSEANIAIKNIESPSFLINFISSNLNAEVEDKQKILEERDLKSRAKLTLDYLSKELQMLELKNDIQSKVRTDLEKQQREYFLHQQIKTIQEELGGNPSDQEVEELKLRAAEKELPEKVAKTFVKELEKLSRMNPSAMEYSVQLNYLDVLVDLPWGEYTEDNFDLKGATKILDRDHFGLEKVKERILEHLAVLKLKGDMKAPILCLHGPPGVGKTSLGKSIAEAIGRKYVRMSLGGLRDEAEIRGHRKTYIGAMPGRIIQNLRKVQAANPVFILDEIDKVGNDFHGDPSSALLEVLDPAQNDSFYDNFIEAEFDLSKVMFIATANNLGAVHPALRDRMEVIEISGYTIEEKIEIAKRHLVPKQLKEHGLTKKEAKISPKAIEKLVENYTRESGVRTLDKKVAAIVRRVAKHVAMEEEYSPSINIKDLKEFLGPGHPRDKYQGTDVAGVVTGLAWTSIGGDILFIEASLSRGKGKLTLTGNLGDVMKESAVIALEYLKVHSEALGIDPGVFDKWNVHKHVPEGATPKDGPSAGITMLTALASVFTQRKVRSRMAMTVEITLRGRVLPVGGIKEKLLAAKRASVTDVLLSEGNRQDVEEITPEYLKGLTIHYVKEMIDVVAFALLDEKVKNAQEIN